MIVHTLRLTNFKSYSRGDFHFHERLNLLHGLNGAGKTNLLDALHLLAMTKSYFQAADSRLRHHGQDFYRVEGKLIKDNEQHTVVVKSGLGRKKVVEKNGSAYERLSHHLGFFPLVMIAPDDMVLVDGDNSDRRRFVDQSLAQISGDYLRALIAYRHILKQRNSLLRQGNGSRGSADRSLLMSFSERMAPLAEIIGNERQAFFDAISPIVTQYHRAISGTEEQVACCYIPDVPGRQFIESAEKSIARDQAMGRTTSGTHRDKIELKIEGLQAKQFGSQGQRKCLVLSLKLAQYKYLAEHARCKPVLLLDDIFDRLDPRRAQQLINIVLGPTFGQIFITDTQLAPVANLLEGNEYLALEAIANPAYANEEE